MSDRLVELLRQRTALQAELAQLDQQIADATAAAVEIPTTPATPRPRPSIVPSNADPEELFAQYENNPRQITTDVRKGCFAYAAVAMLLLVAAVYFLLRFYPH